VREPVIVLCNEPGFVVLAPALPPRDVSVFLAQIQSNPRANSGKLHEFK
jgi:hypothetical protein